MVKLTVIVFLSVAVTFAVGAKVTAEASAKVPEIFRGPGLKDDKDCRCRFKGCLDGPCEELHCIHQNVSLGIVPYGL